MIVKLKQMMCFMAVIACTHSFAQDMDAMAKEAAKTEVWEPVPPKVEPGKMPSDAPSDAIVLFDGKNLDKWESEKDTSKAAGWDVANGIITVNKKAGDIRTKQRFTNFQLHIEYKIPENITGDNQARGNSGIFPASPTGQNGYEVQVLDNYTNKTYVNGEVGSIYKQSIPLANACKKAGEWNVYDIVWKAPLFNEDGKLKSPATVTVILNGIVVQNNYELKGQTPWIGAPTYEKHGPSPIKLQAHGDPSEPISFRNIWLREL